MPPQFSFIIPTYEGYELVSKCVLSLKKFEPDFNNYEIIVVQDGGTTVIAEQIKKFCDNNNVKFFFKDRNEGFAKTVNYGIDRSSGEFVVLVNNDITFTSPVIKNFLTAFSIHPKIGVVGALLRYPDGRIQHGGTVRSDKFFNHCIDHRSNISKYVPAVTGALFAIRREMMNEIGKLDESYFMSCEDADYCLRAWWSNWRVYYSKDVQAVHVEGATRGNTAQTKAIKGKAWAEAEMVAHKKFQSKLNANNLAVLDSSVYSANLELTSKTYKETVKSTNSKIFGIVRAGALGDVIMTTGLIRRIHEENPEATILVSTRIPDVFLRTPYVKTVPCPEPFVDPFPKEATRINLDLAYERTPKRHIISSYADIIFNDPNIFEIPEVVSTPADYISFGQKMVLNKLGQRIPPNSVVVHMGNNWANRTWPIEKWREVVNELIRKGLTVFTVGRGQDFSIKGNNIISLNDKFHILEIRELIQRTKLFIGMDSGLLYIAQTTKTPNIGLFTCANPEYRLFRKEKTIALIPDVVCRFCLHEEKPPVCYVGCKFGHFQCLKDITPKKVLQAAAMLGV